MRARVWTSRMLSALNTTTARVKKGFTSGGRQQLLLSRLDKADHLLALHRREAGEEFVNGLTAFEIVHKVLYRHPCPGEHGSSAHDLQIRVEDFGQIAFAHKQNLPLRPSPGKTSRQNLKS